MNRIAVVLVGLFMDGTAWAQKPPLLPEKDVAAIAQTEVARRKPGHAIHGALQGE